VLPPPQGFGDDWKNAQAKKTVDIERMACLLCQRMLGDIEKLEKHVRVDAAPLFQTVCLAAFGLAKFFSGLELQHNWHQRLQPPSAPPPTAAAAAAAAVAASPWHLSS